jgi:hypothetical protein
LSTTPAQSAKPAAATPPAARHRLPDRAAVWDALWPLGLYAVVSLVLFGLPIVDHPRGSIVAADDIDASQFMWFFSWWPHALLNGLNPFVTELMFVPDGFNLQWATSMPLPSVLLAPITLTAGPAATWNLIQLASPALSAWTAFLLCRHVTGRLWPSLAGGYVFGFSPYMLAHVTGGPYLALVPLVPLFVLLVLLRLRGSLGRRGFVVSMAAALAAQYLTSIEVLATSTLFGALALAVAFVLFAHRRRDLLEVAGLLAMSYLAMAILVAPFLYYFFFGTQYPPGATYFRADLAAFALPPDTVAITNSHQPGAAFKGSVLETYLGLPLILVIVLFAGQWRRSRVAWLLLICLGAAAVLSLGQELIVRGEFTGIWMPWEPFIRLPVINHAIAVRLALYVALAAAMIVALWLTRGGVARWALALLAIAFILPDVGNRAWHTDISDPPFVSTGKFREYLTPRDRVLTIPAWGPNERWQANADFDFKLAAGYAGNPFPRSYSRYPIWNAFISGKLPRDYPRELRRFVRDKGVTAIVVDKRHTGPWRRLFGSLGVRPQDTGGVLLYRLDSRGDRARLPSR